MPTRYFECKEDGSSKFWEITWEVASLEYETRWGPIGGTGTRKAKSFSTKNDRDADVNKIIRSKLIKGYQEKKTIKEESKSIKSTDDYLEIW